MTSQFDNKAYQKMCQVNQRKKGEASGASKKKVHTWHHASSVVGESLQQLTRHLLTACINPIPLPSGKLR